MQGGPRYPRGGDHESGGVPRGGRGYLLSHVNLRRKRGVVSPIRRGSQREVPLGRGGGRKGVGPPFRNFSIRNRS